MRINIQPALRALGIKHHVNVIDERLPGGIAGCTHPFDPTTVKIDLGKCRWLGEGSREIAGHIGHELVHVAQFSRIGNPHRASQLYSHESDWYGYEGNRFEREAYALQDRVAELIEVTA